MPKEKRIYRNIGTPRLIVNTQPRLLLKIQAIAKPLIDPPKWIIVIDRGDTWTGHLAFAPKGLEYTWPKMAWEAVASADYIERPAVGCECNNFDKFFLSEDTDDHSDYCMWHPNNFNTGII